MTHKKTVGISQSSLEHGRNRAHRILEAIIDKHKPTKEEFKTNCPHHSYCNVKKFGRINCLTDSTIKTCQTYKFYEKYGKGYNEMFI